MQDIRETIKKRIAKATRRTIEELNMHGASLYISHITSDLKELTIADSETKEVYYTGSCYEWCIICIAFDLCHLLNRMGVQNNNWNYKTKYILEPSVYLNRE